MIRFFIFSILFFFQLGASEISLTKEELDFLNTHPVIKVSNEENWVPFDFRIGDNPTGYSHDLLKLFEKKIGVKFEYVPKPSWGVIWKDFTKKKIDVIHPTVEVEKRKKFGNYTQSFFSAKCVFVTKQNKPKIKNIEDLFGKVIASPRKWSKTEFLIKEFPQIKVLLTDTMEEAYEAVKQKKAYATVAFASVVNYMLRKNMNRNFKINAEFDELNERDHDFRHMIRKDWPLLISIFNKAYNSITMEEINNIQKKWFPSGVNRSTNIFTKKERKWLEKNSFIKLAYVKYWDNEHMEKTHMERQYVNLLSKYSNVGIQLVQYDSWAEAYEDSLVGKNIQGILFLTKEEEKEKYFDYLPAYFFMPSYVLIHKDNEVKKLRDLEGKSIFVRKGSPFNEFIKKLPYKIDIVSLKTEKEIFEKLSNPNSEVKAGISNRVDRNFFEKNHIKVAKKIYNEYSDIHIGVNKHQNIAHSILQKAHNSIPKEELTKMKNRLFSKGDIVLKSSERRYLYNKKDITMCINPNWMPFSKLEEGKTDGMISNFIEIISSAVNKKVTVKNVKSWQEVMRFMEDGHCDIISFLKKTKHREKYLNFTKPVITTSYVVTTTNEKYFIDDFDAIKNKVFAVVEGAPVYNDVKSIYPNANFIFVKNIEEGFKKVLEGKAYGLIDTSASIAYTVDKLGYHNFKIINKLNLDTRLSFGVKKDDEMLFNIIEKIVNNISREEIRKIYNKQIFLQKEKVIDHSLLWKIVLGAVIILMIFLYRSREISKHNKLLRSKNRLLKEAQKEIEEKNIELEKLSTTDKLTGINNRAKIDEILKNEIKRSNRYSNMFAFALLDIDYFKMVNDTYGHQVGDEVLKEIAQILKNNVREIDFVGRWGGEEFVVILTETNKENALIVCENIRKIIESHDFIEIGKKTTSIGLSEYMKNDTVETIVKRADEALYEAKKTGRNKVVSKYI